MTQKKIKPKAVKGWAIQSSVGIIFVAMDRDTVEEVLAPHHYPLNIEKTWKVIPVKIIPINK